MPDAELPVVGECIAQETAVVGRTGEGNGKPLPRSLPGGEGGMRSIDNCFYAVAEGTRFGVEIDAAEVIANRIKEPHLLPLPEGEGRTGCTEIERAPICREYRIGFKYRVLLEKWRQQ